MADGGFPSRRILETGRGALDGADLLREAPSSYKSNVEYPEDNPIAQSLKGIAQVMSAELGTRIYYAAHGSFDTHTNELVNHALLWDQLSKAVECFWDDIQQQGKGNETVIWMFSEFGRRIADNGTGTDHGSGGVAFMIGDSVKGGFTGTIQSWTYQNNWRGTCISIQISDKSIPPCSKMYLELNRNQS